MQEDKHLIIAIDGPSASGKGTLCRKLADHLGLMHLDTGATYRLVALRLMETGANPDDEAVAEDAAQYVADHFAPEQLDNPALRAGAVGPVVSRLSVHQNVRKRMVALQRAVALSHEKGAVLDGRDIGTVVFPDAPVKLYVSASAEERAKRRFLELQNKGEQGTYDAVLADLKARDERDATRAVDPLRPAADAIPLDTTGLSPDEALSRALQVIESALSKITAQQ